MIPEILAILCSGLFAGASAYINLVEHPARMACGSALAVAEFRPSYRRGAVMQASLAAVGSLAAVIAWWIGGGPRWLIGGVLLGSVMPFTLMVILPTNKELLDPSLDSSSRRATQLLSRWGRLHTVRSLLSAVGFGIFVVQR